MASLLSIDGLTYHYPGAAQPVFQNISLDVQHGEFVAVVGGSGVGKSTLLRCVGGLINAQSGGIHWHSQANADSRQHGIVFQDGRLMPWRNLRDNIAYGMQGLALDDHQKQERIADVLELTRLAHLAERWPHQLSGGQVQRGGIARALAVHPDLLLMDEPFSAVDAITREHLQDELSAIMERIGAAVVFITHDIEEAVYLADRVVVLAGSPAGLALEVQVKDHLSGKRDRQDPALQALAQQIAQAL
ncbi:ABC transporter ATP-binding protein [Pokkaliibacter sp. CJK22405]|uniref:ABC transporter ATP-binding protein n=1 Tax=Pokkaliibacter sp. CJK22405 TaxID=3384615 RepID=UPI003984D45A